MASCNGASVQRLIPARLLRLATWESRMRQRAQVQVVRR
jgi:hypothetical protein